MLTIKQILTFACLCFTFSTFGLNLVMKSKYLGKNPVFVAGGSSGVGLEVVKQLSSLGTPVRALVRRPESVELLKSIPLVTPILGDAVNEADVQGAMNGCIAAITTLGGKNADGSRVDYFGNSNVSVKSFFKIKLISTQ